jgi:hypothetical protein
MHGPQGAPVQQCTGATRQGLNGLDERGDLSGVTPKVDGQDPPTLELSIGAFSDRPQARQGNVGGLLARREGLLPALAPVPDDRLWVQADVAQVGQQPEKFQYLLGDPEAAGRGDVHGLAG